MLQIQAGPSGAPAGFAVDWIRKADYDAWGGWPAAGTDTSAHYCDFVGSPTLLVSSGETSYQLTPGQTIQVEVGNLFDETGMYGDNYGELADATAFVFRAHAEGSGTVWDSPSSPLVFTATSVSQGHGCTLTQGFWKTHASTWAGIGLTLGNVGYTQTQLLQILNQPAQGNGLIFLAHQLIAAKLNAYNGASTAAIQATIASADALIGNLVVPPIGSGSLTPSSASSLTDALNQYNNGRTAVDGCTTSPITRLRAVTWGQLRHVYR